MKDRTKIQRKSLEIQFKKNDPKDDPEQDM
jgi:hypothetical protein